MVHLVDDGSVQFADPDAAWLARVWVDEVGGRARIGALKIDVRDPRAPVTAGRLAALPLAHLLHVASVHLAAAQTPNEAYYRMLATPKPAGQRHWDDGHWGRVLTVHEWAKAAGRPGGPRRCVAEFWNVALDPTVNRWLAEARRRQQEQE